MLMKAFLAYRYLKPAGGALFRLRNTAVKNYNLTAFRSRITTETGAVLPEPVKTQFGVLRALAMILPGLYLGATISKESAAFLEENDIFVPDEDDDED